MLKFLSFFRRNKDEQLNDNEYDFNETLTPVDVQGVDHFPQTTLTENAIGGKQENPDPPTTRIDTARQTHTGDQEKIQDIEDELRNMLDNQTSSAENEPVTLETTDSITKEEFDKLPRDAKFSFLFGHEDGISTARFEIHGEEVKIIAEFPTDAREKVPAKNLRYFSIQDDGKKLVYPPVFPSQKEEADVLSGDSKTSYYIDNLQPRKKETDKAKIDRMSPGDLVNELRQLQGQELLFYTGAGISMGGERPVWGMEQLKTQLGLQAPDFVFFETFAHPDQFPPAEVTQKVSQFGQQLFEDTSTPAHESIAQLVHEIPGTAVFTENIDLKHEAKGSRIKPVHMDSDPGKFDKLKARASDAQILITAGLSYDDRAVIAYLKQQNPDLKIVCFALSADTIPNYLDDHDAVLLGDVQETLPKVAEAFKNEPMSGT